MINYMLFTVAILFCINISLQFILPFIQLIQTESILKRLDNGNSERIQIKLDNLYKKVNQTNSVVIQENIQGRKDDVKFLSRILDNVTQEIHVLGEEIKAQQGRDTGVGVRTHEDAQQAVNILMKLNTTIYEIKNFLGLD